MSSRRVVGFDVVEHRHHGIDVVGSPGERIETGVRLPDGVEHDERVRPDVGDCFLVAGEDFIAEPRLE